MEYTSQYGQDKWISEEVFPDKKNGYFVDLAAGDGIFLSNTYFLEKNMEWKGLCIEPSTFFTQLKQNRNCDCNNSVVMQDGFEVEFIEYEKITEFEHLLSTVSGTSQAPYPIKSTTKHTSVSLDTLLNKYNAPQIINYISMDIEGSELYVLQDFLPKNERTILTWSIECNPGSEHESSILSWMKEYDYELVIKEGTNGRLGHDYLFKLKNI
jgi:FkbM family methyltransferase